MKKHLCIVLLFTALYSKYATAQNDSQAKGVINGHEYVDLGLSVRWATCNVGAEKPHDYGNYYYWGETRQWINPSQVCHTNGMDLDDISGTARDIACVKWGKPWRMPTEGELNEIKDLCTWEWIVINGHKGYRITGPNGNSIFLPTYTYEGYESDAGAIWSSTPYKNDMNDSAYDLTYIAPLEIRIAEAKAKESVNKEDCGFEDTYLGSEILVSPSGRGIRPNAVRPVTDY